MPDQPHTHQILNPATEEVVATVPATGADRKSVV